MRNRRYLLALALTTGAIAAGAGVAAAASGSGTTTTPAAKAAASDVPTASTPSQTTPKRAPRAGHNCPNMGARTTSGAPDAGSGPSVAY
jgi:hypothetical protein